MSKTEEQIITEATDVAGSDDEVTDLLSALECFYMHGVSDAFGGDVESTTGHFYRVDRWLVITDNYGFRNVETHEDVIAASHAFDSYEKEFGQSWGGHDE